jgi:hypothetical protein
MVAIVLGPLVLRTALLLITGQEKKKRKRKKEKIFFFFLFCSGEKAKGSTVLFYKSISARHSQHGVRIYCPEF